MFATAVRLWFQAAACFDDNNNETRAAITVAQQSIVRPAELGASLRRADCSAGERSQYVSPVSPGAVALQTRPASSSGEAGGGQIGDRVRLWAITWSRVRHPGGDDDGTKDRQDSRRPSATGGDVRQRAWALFEMRGRREGRCQQASGRFWKAKGIAGSQPGRAGGEGIGCLRALVLAPCPFLVSSKKKLARATLVLDAGPGRARRTLLAGWRWKGGRMQQNQSQRAIGQSGSLGTYSNCALP